MNKRILITSSLVGILHVLVGASTDCPWSRGSPETSALNAACLCALNIKHEYSVQCSSVDFPLLMGTLHGRAKDVHFDLLYINNSNIEAISDRTFFGLRIRNLQLSFCGIQNISNRAFEGLETTLENLNLQDNLLKQIPTFPFASLQSLQLLDISGNRFTRIPNRAFYGSKLSTLKLSENAISLSPDAFSGLEDTLKNLNMKGCQLNQVPLAVRRLRSLAFLDLAQNNIRNLAPGVLEALHSLTALNLERNLLQDLDPDMFSGVSDTLSSLSLLNNLLTKFPIESINSLPKLRVLDIGFNLITEIPENAFYNIHALTLLAVDGNPLRTLPEIAFRHLNGTLRGLSLGGHYFHCDCRLEWVIRWITNFDLQVTSRDRDPQFCGQPKSLRTKSFYQLRSDDLVCNEVDTPEIGLSPEVPEEVKEDNTEEKETFQRPQPKETEIDLQQSHPPENTKDEDGDIVQGQKDKNVLPPKRKTEKTSVSTYKPPLKPSTRPIPPVSKEPIAQDGEKNSFPRSEAPPQKADPQRKTVQRVVPEENLDRNKLERGGSKEGVGTVTKTKKDEEREAVRKVVEEDQRPHGSRERGNDQETGHSRNKGHVTKPRKPPIVRRPQERPRSPQEFYAQSSSRENLYGEEVIVQDAFWDSNEINIQWDSEVSNILGFRVVYRLFGDKYFKMGQPLSPSAREFRIKNVPANEYFVACVVSLEEMDIKLESVPFGQCREIRTGGASGKLSTHMDKIIIAASASICGTVIIAVIIFICCYRGKSKPENEKVGIPAVLNSSSPPLASLGTLGNAKTVPDWDTISMYSQRSIPRARMYHADKEDARSHISHMSTKSRPRSLADGQSQRSFSGMSGVHMPPAHFASPLSLSRPDLRLSRQSLAHSQFGSSQFGSGYPHFSNGGLISRATSQRSERRRSARSKSRERASSRLSHAGSSHSLTGYDTDGWTDHDMDIYMARNPTRGGLVQL